MNEKKEEGERKSHLYAKPTRAAGKVARWQEALSNDRQAPTAARVIASSLAPPLTGAPTSGGRLRSRLCKVRRPEALRRSTRRRPRTQRAARAQQQRDLASLSSTDSISSDAGSSARPRCAGAPHPHQENARFKRDEAQASAGSRRRSSGAPRSDTRRATRNRRSFSHSCRSSTHSRRSYPHSQTTHDACIVHSVLRSGDAFGARCSAGRMHRMHDAGRCTAGAMHSMHGAQRCRCIECTMPDDAQGVVGPRGVGAMHMPRESDRACNRNIKTNQR